MPMRKTRRACGLALGLMVTWGPMHARAETKHGVTRASDITGSSVVELESSTLEATAEHEDFGPAERIVERYLNRAIKLERFVAQDDEGNYFNHGKWTQWDENGRMAASGVYRNVPLNQVTKFKAQEPSKTKTGLLIAGGVLFAAGIVWVATSSDNVTY